MTIAAGAGRPMGEVTLTDAIELVGDPFTFAPGHRLRGLRCLLCGMTAGGRLMRFAAVIDTRCFPTACGGAVSVCFVICAEHGADPDLDVATPAITRHNMSCRRPAS